jgi:hypothetical protein
VVFEPVMPILASQDSECDIVVKRAVSLPRVEHFRNWIAALDSSGDVDIEIIKKCRKIPGFGKVILVERRGI